LPRDGKKREQSAGDGAAISAAFGDHASQGVKGCGSRQIRDAGGLFPRIDAGAGDRRKSRQRHPVPFSANDSKEERLELLA
jgi:hypothetical protein